MRICNFLTFIFLVLVGFLSITECSFPKCEDIVTIVDGKPLCSYCVSERMQKECKDVCEKNGCNKASTTSSPQSNPNVNGSDNGNGGSSKPDSSCNDIDPCTDINSGNKKFQANCKAKGLQDSCIKYCRYDATKRELQNAFLHGECDISEARDMLRSAANNKNNVYCCKKKHVLDGDKSICEPFCNPDGDNWPTKADGKYLKCMGEFDNMMKCHWAAQRP